MGAPVVSSVVGRRGPVRPAAAGASPPPFGVRLVTGWGLSRTDRLRLLRSSRLFADLDPAVVERLWQRTQPRAVPAGAELMGEGDPADGAFFVVTGRLQVLASDEHGSERPVAEVGPGSVLGEMSLLTGGERSATVRALRDAQLMWLSAADFRTMVMAEPELLLALTRVLATRLDRSIHGRHPAAAVRVVGLVPAGSAPAHRALAGAFRPAQPGATTRLIDSESLTADLGDEPAEAEIAAHLHRVEAGHDLTLLVADDRITPWTRRCIRQTDVVLFVGEAGGLDSSGEAETLWFGLPPGSRPPAHLVVVHRAGTPIGTAGLLAARQVDRHHHVQLEQSADLARLGRVLARTSVGLVLGGGGARGYAHLGVVKALLEANVPIDHIGGTSIGASVAGAFAMGWDWETMAAMERRVTIDQGSLVDLSFPAVALARGRKLTAGMRAGYGDTDIADLWTDFFCVSTDLTLGQARVHRSGPVWRAVRASVSIPGMFPPVRDDDGHVLVDGSLLDNLPIGPMAELYAPATLLAVDLQASSDLPAADLPDDGVVSGWRVAARRLNPWRPSLRVPRMVDVLASATAVSGHEPDERADLVFRPPIEDFGKLDFAAHERIVQAGYHHAVEMLEKADLAQIGRR